MKKGKRTNKKYSPEFKISVILDMRNNDLTYRGTTKKYNLPWQRVQKWERIYLEEGEAGFYVERRGRTTKLDNPKAGRPKKKQLDAKVESPALPLWKKSAICSTSCRDLWFPLFRSLRAPACAMARPI